MVLQYPHTQTEVSPGDIHQYLMRTLCLKSSHCTSMPSRQSAPHLAVHLTMPFFIKLLCNLLASPLTVPHVQSTIDSTERPLGFSLTLTSCFLSSQPIHFSPGSQYIQTWIQDHLTITYLSSLSSTNSPTATCSPFT